MRSDLEPTPEHEDPEELIRNDANGRLDDAMAGDRRSPDHPPDRPHREDDSEEVMLMAEASTPATGPTGVGSPRNTTGRRERFGRG